LSRVPDRPGHPHVHRFEFLERKFKTSGNFPIEIIAHLSLSIPMYDKLVMRPEKECFVVDVHNKERKTIFAKCFMFGCPGLDAMSL